ncbi:MAG: DUF4340 domain-containing protein [Clostridia bacterium]|nr:DUF4340 domain-containing protein [Clostridia bacterium]
MADEKKTNDIIETEEENIVDKLGDTDSLKNEKEIKAVNFKKIALIIAVVVVLAVIAIACAIFLQPEPDAVVDNSRPVTFASFIKANVVNLTIEKADGTVLSFSQDEEDNVIYDADPDYPLNSAATSLLTAAASVKARDTVFDDQEKKSECGFDSPSVIANVTYDDGSSLRITVGSKTAKGTTYYAIVDGYEGIYEIDSSFPSLMMRDITEFRNYVVFTAPDPNLIDEIKYSANGQVVHFKPYGADEFNYSVLSIRMISPYDIDADTQSYSELVSALSEIAFKGYAGKADKGLSQFGLDEPTATVYVHDSEGAEIDIVIGSKADSGDYYAALAENLNDVYFIDDSFVNMLCDTPVSEYIGSFVGLINFALVDSIYVETDDASYDMKISRQVQYEEDGKTVATDNNGNTVYKYDYEINGKVIEEKPFKDMYTSIIGVTIDGTTPTDENGELPEIGQTGGMKVTYGFYDDTQDEVTVEFRPYKNLYYAQRKNDNPFWFISSKEKVDTAIAAVESVATTGQMPAQEE